MKKKLSVKKIENTGVRTSPRTLSKKKNCNILLTITITEMLRLRTTIFLRQRTIKLVTLRTTETLKTKCPLLKVRTTKLLILGISKAVKEQILCMHPKPML